MKEEPQATIPIEKQLQSLKLDVWCHTELRVRPAPLKVGNFHVPLTGPHLSLWDSPSVHAHIPTGGLKIMDIPSHPYLGLLGVLPSSVQGARRHSQIPGLSKLDSLMFRRSQAGAMRAHLD